MKAKSTRALKEVSRATSGPTWIASGRVLKPSVVGCPPCDTIYLKFHRPMEKDTIICVTPDEARLLIALLTDALGGK